jgi:hypothetical protein
MATVLPPIGRNGIVNSVRKLSGNIITGWRNVASAANFIAGYIATLDSDGNAVVADDSSTQILGLFFCHKTTSFYRPIVDEEATFTGSGTTVTLAHANLQSGSVRVTDSAGTAYTVTTDYTVNNTNGTITHVGGGGIGVTETVLVDYRYQDPNLAGLDQTLGSGRAAIVEGTGEIATLVYETNAAWALNTDVTVSANGLPTIGGGGQVIGFVTKVPTSSDPELQFQMRMV